ncbi:pimeloyl-ACP methyl ester carboxylesterase [Prauserella sediminis]|uniref:Pimeloyl-ACP methyl ester carboxylesterase n=1 Tax=Prauserella sediminis TaxID=577680 RepID=A0A839XRE1_9PSEU|nr:alpha/beta fold hydrolase [Prauserella sediminis]MBB3665277.1 pimeloyl-ACP methyl ester carboxylesterase [Prauserella sediminis]
MRGKKPVPARQGLYRVPRSAVIGVGALALCCAGFTGLNIALLSSDSPVGHWRSEEAKQEYEHLYEQAMELMPEPVEQADVQTEFGTVRAYLFKAQAPPPGDHDRTPLVLLPGFGGPAVTWYASIADLAAERPVIAIDTLGMAGMSDQIQPITSTDDQIRWLRDVLAELAVDRAHLVGFSFGGLTAATYASQHPDQVASLTLLDPAYVFAPVNKRFLVGGFVASFPLMPDSFASWYTSWISGGTDAATKSPLAGLLDHGRRHYATKLPIPEQLPKEKLAGIETPTLAVLAGQSVVHDAQDAAETATTMPNVRVRIEPDASHAVHIEHHDDLLPVISSFIAGHDRDGQ